MAEGLLRSWSLTAPRKHSGLSVKDEIERIREARGEGDGFATWRASRFAVIENGFEG